jgi:hypothetical protein
LTPELALALVIRRWDGAPIDTRNQNQPPAERRLFDIYIVLASCSCGGCRTLRLRIIRIMPTQLCRYPAVLFRRSSKKTHIYYVKQQLTQP